MSRRKFPTCFPRTTYRFGTGPRTGTGGTGASPPLYRSKTLG
jgi:hypothetical protein